jgi:aspartyl-tRNA(Asn)/glutamyl-tRNA(Gln) amidotransferase subunit A
MTEHDLSYLSIAELAPMLQSGELSPVDVTTAALERVASMNPGLNAFISIQAEAAMASARAAENELRRGRRRGPLHGVPVALKDLYATEGVPTTGGSRAFAGVIPEHDATVTARLKEAGAVIVGKLNLNELAYGPTGYNRHFGPGRNPWNPAHLPGGSSSGSAIAVAAGLVYAALGTDTTGSIRIPAALCGITGLKPTFGRVSLQGVMALAWTLDHGGPMARSAEDCALILQAIAGHDLAYPYSLDAPAADYRGSFRDDLIRVRVAIPADDLFERAQPEVLASVSLAIGVLETLGAHVERVSIPLIEEANEVSSAIVAAEAAAAYLPLLKNDAADVDPSVRRRLQAGFAIPGPLYVHAQRLRREFAAQVGSLMLGFDAIATPTVPTVAPRLLTDRSRTPAHEAESRRTLTQFTRPFNLSGQPAVALPCGFSSDGLPISLQVIGRPLEDELVLQIGHAYQRATDWHRRRPPVSEIVGGSQAPD